MLTFWCIALFLGKYTVPVVAEMLVLHNYIESRIIRLGSGTERGSPSTSSSPRSPLSYFLVCRADPDGSSVPQRSPIPMDLCQGQQCLDSWTSLFQLNGKLGQKERWFVRVPSEQQSVLKNSTKILPDEFFHCCTLQSLPVPRGPSARGFSIPPQSKLGVISPRIKLTYRGYVFPLFLYPSYLCNSMSCVPKSGLDRGVIFTFFVGLCLSALW